MITVVLSGVSVFAASQYVADTAEFQMGTVNSGWAILEGYRDTSSDRLSNINSRKLQYGTTTCTLGTISRPNQFSAKMDVKFYTNGTLKQTNHLGI